jgi:hypothetical protein
VSLRSLSLRSVVARSLLTGSLLALLGSRSLLMLRTRSRSCLLRSRTVCGLSGRRISVLVSVGRSVAVSVPIVRDKMNRSVAGVVASAVGAPAHAVCLGHTKVDRSNSVGRSAGGNDCNRINDLRNDSLKCGKAAVVTGIAYVVRLRGTAKSEKDACRGKAC